MDDAQIINLYFARDENAIVETKNKYQNMCYIVAHNILYSRKTLKECVNDKHGFLPGTAFSKKTIYFVFLCFKNNKKYSNRPLSEKKCAETGGFTYGRYCWGSGKNWKCNFF